MNALVMTDVSRHVDGGLNEVMQTMEPSKFPTPVYFRELESSLPENFQSGSDVDRMHTTRGSLSFDSITASVTTSPLRHGDVNNVTFSPLCDPTPHPLGTPTQQSPSALVSGQPNVPFPHQHSVLSSSIYSRPIPASSHHSQTATSGYLVSNRPHTIPRFSRLQSRGPSVAGYGSLGNVNGVRPPFSPPLLPTGQKIFGSSVSTFSGSSNGLEAEPREAQTGRKKRKACGHCTPCQRKENCGTCMNCINRTKGKQICIHRKCDVLKKKAVTSQSTLPPTAPGQDKRKDFEGHPPRAAKRSKSSEQPSARLSQGILHPSSHPNFSKFGDMSRIPTSSSDTGEPYHKSPANLSFFDSARETQQYNQFGLKPIGQVPDTATPASCDTNFLEQPLQTVESNVDSNAAIGESSCIMFDKVTKSSHGRNSRAETNFSLGSDCVASINLSKQIPPISLPPAPGPSVVPPIDADPLQSLRNLSNQSSLHHRNPHFQGARNTNIIRRNSSNSFTADLQPTNISQENLTQTQAYNSSNQLFRNNACAGTQLRRNEDNDNQASLLQPSAVQYPQLQARQMVNEYKRLGGYDHPVVGQSTIHNKFQLTSSCIASTCGIATQSFTNTNHSKQRSSSDADVVENNDPNIFLNIPAADSNDGLSFNTENSSFDQQSRAFDQTHNLPHLYGESRLSSSGTFLHNQDHIFAMKTALENNHSVAEHWDSEQYHHFSQHQSMEFGSSSGGTASPGSDVHTFHGPTSLPPGSTDDIQTPILQMSSATVARCVSHPVISVKSPMCVSEPWQSELPIPGYVKKTVPQDPPPLMSAVNADSFSDLYPLPPPTYSSHISPCNPYYDLDELNSGTRLEKNGAGNIDSLVPATILRAKSPVLLKPISPDSLLMKPNRDVFSQDSRKGSTVQDTVDSSKDGVPVSSSVVGLPGTNTSDFADSTKLHNDSADEIFTETMNSVLYEHALPRQSPLLRHNGSNVMPSIEHIAKSHSPAEVHSSISPGESGYDSMELASTQSDSVPQNCGRGTGLHIDPELSDIPGVMLPENDQHPVMDFSDFTLG